MQVRITNLDDRLVNRVIHTDDPDFHRNIRFMSPDHLAIMQACESGHPIQVARTVYTPITRSVKG